MNQRGVDALVSAAMRGVPQIGGDFHRGRARCAGGVLIEAMLGRSIAKMSAMTVWDHFDAALRHYEMSEDEWCRMVEMNNGERVDFIGIARKFGPDA